MICKNEKVQSVEDKTGSDSDSTVGVSLSATAKKPDKALLGALVGGILFASLGAGVAWTACAAITGSVLAKKASSK